MFNEIRVQQSYDRVVRKVRRELVDDDLAEFVDTLHSPHIRRGVVYAMLLIHIVDEPLISQMTDDDYDELIRRLRIRFPADDEDEDEDEDDECDRCGEDAAYLWCIRGRQLCENCADAVGRRHLRRMEERRLAAERGEIPVSAAITGGSSSSG